MYPHKPTALRPARPSLACQLLPAQDNQLLGKLPSREWNRKGAFRSLERLDLSQNSFYGGVSLQFAPGAALRWLSST